MEPGGSIFVVSFKPPPMEVDFYLHIETIKS